MGSNARCCLAIPKGNILSFLPMTGKDSGQGRTNGGGICPDELIGAEGDGLRTLGIVTKGEAGCPIDTGLFGNSPGIGDHRPARSLLPSHQIIRDPLGEADADHV